jgi:hypothetical protein
MFYVCFLVEKNGQYRYNSQRKPSKKEQNGVNDSEEHK